MSMKVTIPPKDCDKINQIIPIMQEHLGLVMNLSRIKLLTFALHALCIVHTDCQSAQDSIGDAYER